LPRLAARRGTRRQNPDCHDPAYLRWSTCLHSSMREYVVLNCISPPFLTRIWLRRVANYMKRLLRLSQSPPPLEPWHRHSHGTISKTNLQSWITHCFSRSSHLISLKFHTRNSDPASADSDDLLEFFGRELSISASFRLKRFARAT
jgi:hypothetical protein